MYRTQRDTGQWFSTDFKRSIKDKEVSPEMGPGKYETSLRPVADKKIVSWNFGAVPFQSCANRFQYNSSNL